MIADLKPYGEYQESGLPWLGKVPAHWDVQKPRHIGSLLKGVGGTKEDALSAGIPCVRYGELYTTHTFFVRKPKAFIHPDRASNYTPLHYGDVLFAASGETLEEIGKSAVNLIEGAAVCGGDVIILRPTVPVHAPFLGYVMDCRSSANQKATMGRGTTVKHIYPDELKNLLFPFPPVPEQAAIVRFLDWASGRLERAIRAKRKVIALLNEQKQAVINRAVSRGLDPSVALKPSGIPWLGDIPQHWGICSVKQLSRRGGRSFTDGDWIELPFITNSGVRLIQTGNVGKGKYREKGFRYVSERTFEAFGCTEVEPNDVLICRLDGPVGRACLAPDLGVRMITSVDNTILKVRPEIDARFVVFLMSSSAWLNWIQSMCRAGGGFRYRISRSMLGSLLVATPPPPEQLAITNFISGSTAPLIASVERLEREIELLREYRTRLVADVVTGKLDVREAAARLPDEVTADTVAEDIDLGDESEIADDEVAV